VPVRPNTGLWFDWTANSQVNTAVLPTVKGCNPITGQQTSGFHMERYEEKCPKHNKPFKAERFCEECGYKWPSQNYVTTPNVLWWDGFRSEDGNVRQFFFTEEELRDVATHMIGKENTVPAFGFAFYRPKEMRADSAPQRLWSITSASTPSWTYTTGGVQGIQGLHGTGGTKHHLFASNSNGSMLSKGLSAGVTPTAAADCSVYACAAPAAGSLMGSLGEVDHEMNFMEEPTKGLVKERYVKCSAPIGIDVRSKRAVESVTVKKDVSVGAGAKIAQSLVQDPYALDTWKDKPDAAMTIYFVFQEVLEEMKSKGMNDFTGKPEGMLAGMPVG
jgi:hypothetical protein